VSLVLHLQGDALNQEIPLSNLLRRAKVVATRLGVSDTSDMLLWLGRELNGYSGPSDKNLPMHRVMVKGYMSLVEGIPPAVVPGRLPHSVSRLESLLAAGQVDFLRFPQIEVQVPSVIILSKFLYRNFARRRSNPDLIVPVSTIYDIFETIRNLILEYALRLERSGVLA